MISIIIPVYNQAKKLDKCLDSIVNQSYQNYEVLVVDDGSADELEPVLVKYKEKFKLKMDVYTQENQGANAARNKGAKYAKGEFIIFVDADIALRIDMLQKMLDTLKKFSEVSYVYSSHKFGYKNFKLHEFDAHLLKQYPYIHTTSLMRKDHFPGFDEKIRRLQDWDLWLTMLEQHHVGVWIPEFLFKVQPGGTMSTWMPSFFYKIFPFLPKVRKYKKAVKTVKKKHAIE